jgi:hypothetical protein
MNVMKKKSKNKIFLSSRSRRPLPSVPSGNNPCSDLRCSCVGGVPFFADLLQFYLELTFVQQTIIWSKTLPDAESGDLNNNVALMMTWFFAEAAIVQLPPMSYNLLIDQRISKFDANSNCFENYKDGPIAAVHAPLNAFENAFFDPNNGFPAASITIISNKFGQPLLPFIASFQTFFTTKMIPASVAALPLFADFLPVLSYLQFFQVAFDFWSYEGDMLLFPIASYTQFQMIYNLYTNDLAAHRARINSQLDPDKYLALNLAFNNLQECMMYFCNAFKKIPSTDAAQLAKLVLTTNSTHSVTGEPITRACNELLQAYLVLIPTS